MHYFLRDYHVHTHHSLDSEALMEEHCGRAIDIGIKEIAFTDHYELNPFDEGKGYFDYDAYWKELNSCRNKMGESLSILSGLEISEPHLYPEKTKEFLSGKNFDLLIGGIHWINDEALYRDFWPQKNYKEAYNLYFEEVFKMAKTADIDILAHLDHLKRYAPEGIPPFNPLDFREEIVAILKIMIERNIALEVNTSALKLKLFSSDHETFPSFEIISWYKELGGELLTLGSDAHNPAFLALGFKEVYSLLEEIGFKGLTVFKNRKPLIESFSHAR